MKKLALMTAIAATLAGTTFAPAFAAKPKVAMKHPSHVTHTPRRAVDPGDAAVDKLNQQQLDQARAK